MAKTVMALAVGRAMAEGKIKSIDLPISKFLTEWKDDPRGNITIRHLLQMRSGLSPLSREGELSQAVRFQFGEGMAELPLGQHLVHPPGTYFEYQNSVSQLACLALERATRERYADFLSRSLWQPLGADDAELWLDRNAQHARCYASLLARPADWLKIGLLLKNFGRARGRQIVPRSWIAEMGAPSPTNPAYGFQIWRSAPFQSVRYYNQQGTGLAIVSAAPWPWQDTIYLDGYGGQRVYVSRCANIVIVRLGRSVFDWDDTRLPNQVNLALAHQIKPVCTH
jgi:CubicO group peptidase (beta-lactamase class C family)